MCRCPLSKEVLTSAVFTLAVLVTLPAGPAAAQSRPSSPDKEKHMQIPGGPMVVKLPDLVIDSLDAFAGQGCTQSGYGLKFKVTVRNAGSQPAQLYAGWLVVHSKDANKRWPNQGYGTAMLLGSGQTTTVTTDWVYAKGYQQSPYGDKGVYYTFHAAIDPGNQIKESNKSNNEKTYKQQASAPCP